jgi:hypothetical protein
MARQREYDEINYPFYSGEEKVDMPSPLYEHMVDVGEAIWYDIDEQSLNNWYDIINLYMSASPKFALMLDGLYYFNYMSMYPQAQAANEHYETNSEKLDEYQYGHAHEPGQSCPFTEDGFFDDQNAVNEDVKYSLYGTVNGNGCGAIATYNALKILEPDKDFRAADIVRDMEPGGMLFGALGTNPLYIVDYFKNLGYDVEINFTKEGVDAAAKDADANIWVYIWIYADEQNNTEELGAHFVAVQPLGSDTYRFYNDLNKQGQLSDLYEDYDALRFMISISKN